MRSNQQLIQKAADSVVSFGQFGQLSPIKSDFFIDKMKEKTEFLKQIRTIKMGGPEVDIDRLSIGQRVLHRLGNGEALSPSKYAQVNTDQIVLLSKKVSATIIVNEETVEDSIEQNTNFSNDFMSSPGGIHSHILTQLADQASLDLVDFALNGDTTIPEATDDLLSLNDGYLKTASSHVLAAANAHISPNTLYNALRLMPARGLNGVNLRYIMSPYTEDKLRMQLALRQTQGGDAYLTSDGSVKILRGTTYAVPFMPDDQVLITETRNLIFGIQRAMRLELIKDIDKGVYRIVAKMRVDCKVQDSDLMVKITGLNTGVLT